MLAPDQAEIWWMKVADVSATLWPRLEAMLDADEVERAGRFQSSSDRQTYVAAHALGRCLLSWGLGGDAALWRFSTDKLGKPEVVWGRAAPRPRLNLSHTGGMVAAALTLDHDIGIDVESLNRKADALALAKRFFSADEHQMLARSEPSVVMDDFLSLWTLKEAVVKANGKGVARQFGTFTIILDPLSIRFADTAIDPRRWLLRQWRLENSHLLALAVDHPDPSRLSVTCRPVGADDLLS